jgi:hypothetical protein
LVLKNDDGVTRSLWGRRPRHDTDCIIGWIPNKSPKRIVDASIKTIHTPWFMIYTCTTYPLTKSPREEKEEKKE